MLPAVRRPYRLSEGARQPRWQRWHRCARLSSAQLAGYFALFSGLIGINPPAMTIAAWPCAVRRESATIRRGASRVVRLQLRDSSRFGRFGAVRGRGRGARSPNPRSRCAAEDLAISADSPVPGGPCAPDRGQLACGPAVLRCAWSLGRAWSTLHGPTNTCYASPSRHQSDRGHSFLRRSRQAYGIPCR